MQGQNIFLDTSRNLFGKYSTAEKFGVGKIFLIFLKEGSYTHQNWIDLIKNTVKTVILWNIITV